MTLNLTYDWYEIEKLSTENIDLERIRKSIYDCENSFTVAMNRKKQEKFRDYVINLIEARTHAQRALISLKSLVINIEEIETKFKEAYTELDKRIGLWMKKIDELVDDIYADIGGFSQIMQLGRSNKGYAKLKTLEEEIKIIIIDFVYYSLLNALIKYNRSDKKEFKIEHYIFQEMINAVNVLGIETRYETSRFRQLIPPINRRNIMPYSQRKDNESGNIEDITEMFVEPNFEEGENV